MYNPSTILACTILMRHPCVQELQRARTSSSSDLEAARKEASQQLQNALQKAEATQSQVAEANRASEQAQSSLQSQQV